MPLDEVILDLADVVLDTLNQEWEHYLEEPGTVRVKAGEDMWLIFHSIKAYTRGAGFTKDAAGVWHIAEDIQAVLISVGGRYIGQMSPGDTMRFIEDLSEVERAILHQYRIRNA